MDSHDNIGLHDSMNLPTKWNINDKSDFLTVSSDGFKVEYTGENRYKILQFYYILMDACHIAGIMFFHPDKNEDYNESKEVSETTAAIRANHPISPQCGLFYFEINIIDKRKNGYVVQFISHRRSQLYSF